MIVHETTKLLREALEFLNDAPSFSLRHDRSRTSYQLASKIETELRTDTPASACTTACAVSNAIRATDWELFMHQKAALARAATRLRYEQSMGDELAGLLHFLDAVQDAAHAEGFPVVWPADDDHGKPGGRVTRKPVTYG